MDTNEQAREALAEFAKWAIREGAFQAADIGGLEIQEKAQELGLIEPTAYDPDKHGPSDCAEVGDDWFVFSPLLSPTTPVDGVGAEPRDDAARIVYDVMSWASGLPGPSGETIPAWGDPASAIFRDKASDAARKISALASPEAEARLRERVAELERLIHQLRTSQPDNFAVSQQWKKRAEAAEARLAQAEGGPAVTEAWQPIESAPLDGTTVDLWHEDFGRHTDHYWGVPSHECGEAGSFCDSDWHSISEGWVDGTFNSLSDEPQGFTHWMPHPKPPAALHPQSAAGEEGK